MYDLKANLAYATVAIAPSPALSGTQLTVASGLGALFPTAPFNCVLYPPYNPTTGANRNPLAATAEIVRVTNRTGDVFTITRAQEGTSAKSITAGWQIANTASALSFTQIQDSIIQFVSAGSTKASASEVVFSNANGVSFGVDGQTITASVAITATGGGGGAAISAGTQSNSTGTIVFSNSNGVSFGMSNSSVVTASHDGLTSQSNQAASASNGSFAFQTIGFSNANNVTFGTSGGSIITASVAPPTAGSVNFSAGTTSNNLTNLVFSNSNGVSFGLNGSSITASHNGLTSQSNQAASASNGSFTFQTLGFSNANNVTFGTSAGSIITASVSPGGGGGSINFSAGTQSSDLASIVFSNSNGVSFGLSNGTITASAAGGSGGGYTASAYYPYGSLPVQFVSQFGLAFIALGIANLPTAVQFDRIAFPISANLNPGNSTGGITVSVGFYTRNGSTLSLSLSTSTAYSILHTSSAAFSAIKILTIGWTSTLPAGDYHYGFWSSISGANHTIINGMVNGGSNSFNGIFGATPSGSAQSAPGVGYLSASTNVFRNSIAFSDINGSQSFATRVQPFYLLSQTV